MKRTSYLEEPSRNFCQHFMRRTTQQTLSPRFPRIIVKYTITGFNVIEEVVIQENSIGTEHGITRLVQTAFPCLSEVKAMSLVDFMQAKEEESDTGFIRLGKHHVQRPGETVWVKCAIHFGLVEEDLPVVFETEARGRGLRG